MMTSELVASLRQHDRSAQERFLRRYAPRVFALAQRMLPHREDAEELTQDVMLRAMQDIGGYDAQRASLETWLWRMTYSMALTQLRSSTHPPQASLEELSTRELADAATTLDDDRPENLERLHRAIELLTPEDQGLIWLFYNEERSLADIADIVQQKPGTIATRLHRIRLRLHQTILKLKPT